MSAPTQAPATPAPSVPAAPASARADETDPVRLAGLEKALERAAYVFDQLALREDALAAGGVDDPKFWAPKRAESMRGHAAACRAALAPSAGGAQ